MHIVLDFWHFGTVGQCSSAEQLVDSPTHLERNNDSATCLVTRLRLSQTHTHTHTTHMEHKRTVEVLTNAFSALVLDLIKFCKSSSVFVLHQMNPHPPPLSSQSSLLSPVSCSSLNIHSLYQNLLYLQKISWNFCVSRFFFFFQNWGPISGSGCSCLKI